MYVLKNKTVAFIIKLMYLGFGEMFYIMLLNIIVS